MRRSIKTIIAVFAVGSFPALAVAPAVASIDRTVISIDCIVGDTGENDHALAPGESVTITLTNCDNDSREISDANDTGNATLDGVVLTSSSVTIDSDPATIVVDEYAALTITEFGDIDINLATLVDDPEGGLLATETTTLSSTPAFFETPVDAEVNDAGDALLGGVLECDVEVGAHPYNTIDFTITEAGTYTFRVVDTDPVEEDMYFGIESVLSPVGDNFLALYSDFDPADVSAAIVGCNDDADDEGAVAGDLWDEAELEEAARGQNDANIVTSTGYILDDQFAWFTTTLEPGEYTLVGTTYSTFDETTWLTRLSDAETDQASIVFEMWGPEGGLEIGHGLAATGVEPSLALWSGLALAGTGVAITVARRRAQRA